MKTEKVMDKESLHIFKKLKHFFLEEDFYTLFAAELGYADVLAKYLYENKEINSLPTSCKYAILQHASTMVVISKILRNEMNPDDLSMNHMPVYEEAWKSEEDFEKRFIFVIKKFYEDLKEQGKL